MKKFVLSAGVVVAFILYSIHQKNEDASVRVVLPQTNSHSCSTPPPNILYKDGTYTGDTKDAYYGNLQVQATIQNGKIADVLFLQYPNDRRTSVQINAQAMPYLKQEAIQSQTAQVDIVSGATQSSLAFRQSLQLALDKAH